MKAQQSHRWTFFRAGGFDQVRLETGADLQALDQLDQKLWVALACPTQGLEFDAKTLSLIDTDKDGRIRAPEMIAAAKWATSCLRNPDDLLRGAHTLPLSAINDTTDEGKQLLASARQILFNLGKASATSITVEDTSDTVRIFAQTASCPASCPNPNGCRTARPGPLRKLPRQQRQSGCRKLPPSLPRLRRLLQLLRNKYEILNFLIVACCSACADGPSARCHQRRRFTEKGSADRDRSGNQIARRRSQHQGRRAF